MIENQEDIANIHIIGISTRGQSQQHPPALFLDVLSNPERDNFTLWLGRMARVVSTLGNLLAMHVNYVGICMSHSDIAVILPRVVNTSDTNSPDLADVSMNIRLCSVAKSCPSWDVTARFSCKSSLFPTNAITTSCDACFFNSSTQDCAF